MLYSAESGGAGDRIWCLDNSNRLSTPWQCLSLSMKESGALEVQFPLVCIHSHKGRGREKESEKERDREGGMEAVSQHGPITVEVWLGS